MANETGDDVEEDAEMQLGFAVGGFVTYSINEIFAIQPELLYTMKGAKGTCEWDGLCEEWKDKLTYLEIPVLAKFTIPTEGKIAPNLFIGPALGILLSAKYEWEIDGESDEQDLKEDNKSNLIFFNLINI